MEFAFWPISFEIDKADPANPVLNKMSERQTIDGFEWEIRALKNQFDGEQLKLEFLICCNENCTDKLWMAQAGFSIVADHMDSYSRPNKCYKYFSNANENVKVEYSFYYTKDRERKDTIKIKIELLRSVPSLMKFDTNLEITYGESQENGHTEEKNSMIAVNKHALATFSNYFRNLFFGNWAESRQQQDEITSLKIKEEFDFDIQAFTKMIYASMAMGWMIDKDMFENILLGSIGDDKKLRYKTAIKLLKLSVKYDLPMIQNYCEEYFYSQFKDKDFSKMELLEEAENLGIQKLKERTLNSITAIDFGLNMRKNLQIQSRLGKRTQDELMNQIESNTKRMCYSGNQGYGMLMVILVAFIGIKLN